MTETTLGRRDAMDGISGHGPRKPIPTMPTHSCWSAMQLIGSRPEVILVHQSCWEMFIHSFFVETRFWTASGWPTILKVSAIK